MPATAADPNIQFLDLLAELDFVIASKRADPPPTPDDELDEQIARTERVLSVLRERRRRRNVFRESCPMGPAANTPPETDQLDADCDLAAARARDGCGMADSRAAVTDGPHVDRSTSQEDEDPERFEDPTLRF